MIALYVGVCTFTSCDEKEKNDLIERNDDNQGGQKDTTNTQGDTAVTNALTISEQQARLSGALNTVVRSIDFTDLGQALRNIMAEYGDNTISLDSILASIAAQDEQLANRIISIRELLFVKGDKRVDFEELFFEATLNFMLDTIQFPDGEGGFRDSVVIKPVLSNVNYKADQFKLTIGFNNKENAVIVFKCHNDVESRVEFTDSLTKEVTNITLPDTLELSVAIGSKTVLSANIGYKTDFQVQIEGSGSIIKKRINGVIQDNDKFKLTKLILNGEKLSLNAGVTLDKYSILAKADYDKENGLILNANAQMLGFDVLSIRAKVDATIKDGMDWTDVVNDILPWLTANSDRMARGVDVEAVLGNKDITLLASVDLTDNDILNALIPFIITQPKNEDERNSFRQMTEYFNRRIKGELYFKDYDAPQAKIRFVYDPESAGEMQVINPTALDINAFMNNLKNCGLRIMVDTYDDNKRPVTVSFQEYFGELDIKAIGGEILSKFKNAFGSLVPTTEPLSSGGIYDVQTIEDLKGRIKEIAALLK